MRVELKSLFPKCLDRPSLLPRLKTIVKQKRGRSLIKEDHCRLGADTRTRRTGEPQERRSAKESPYGIASLLPRSTGGRVSTGKIGSKKKGRGQEEAAPYHHLVGSDLS